MSGFSKDWLALREPADHAARAAALDHRLVRWLKMRPKPVAAIGSAVGEPGAARPYHPLRIVDLGAGTGSNLRYLAPRLASDQHWLLIDHDAELLDALPHRLMAWAHERSWDCRREPGAMRITGSDMKLRVTWRRLDLADDLAVIPFAESDLLTASALLDLVSADWIDKLCRLCNAHGTALFTVLNVDGRSVWQPELIDDSWLSRMLRLHQRRDKGLGLALGPEAGPYIRATLSALGFEEYACPSDWHLGSASRQLQHAFAEGWAEACTAISPAQAKRVDAWLCARQRLIDSAESGLIVGHLDVLGLPRV